MKLLEIDTLKFSYDAQNKFEFDLQLSSGKIMVLQGKSGSGKSTLLDLIGGFLQPTSGTIVLGGHDITHLQPSARQVSVLFQKNNVFEHLSVINNVCLALNTTTRPSVEQKNMARKMLDKVGMAQYSTRRAHTLSGGQMQRVALAREMLRPSKLMLLDEPFNGLDDENLNAILPLLQSVIADNQRSIILVTHDLQSVEKIADCIAQIRDGRIHWL